MAKLTDYGIVLLTHFARYPERELSAREISRETRLPLPTVGKLLKELVHGQLLLSHRGTKGGYRLARRPEEISVAHIISVLEGPIALTECNTDIEGLCQREDDCSVRANWQVINRAIRAALEKVALSQMVTPLARGPWIFAGPSLPLHESPARPGRSPLP